MPRHTLLPGVIGALIVGIAGFTVTLVTVLTAKGSGWTMDQAAVAIAYYAAIFVAVAYAVKHDWESWRPDKPNQVSTDAPGSC